jgi:hypothetical protein
MTLFRITYTYGILLVWKIIELKEIYSNLFALRARRYFLTANIFLVMNMRNLLKLNRLDQVVKNVAIHYTSCPVKYALIQLN